MFQRGRTRFISFLSHGTRPFLLLCLLSRSLFLFLRAFFRLVEIVAYIHTHTHGETAVAVAVTREPVIKRSFNLSLVIHDY